MSARIQGCVGQFLDDVGHFWDSSANYRVSCDHKSINMVHPTLSLFSNKLERLFESSKVQLPAPFSNASLKDYVDLYRID